MLQILLKEESGPKKVITLLQSRRAITFLKKSMSLFLLDLIVGLKTGLLFLFFFFFSGCITRLIKGIKTPTFHSYIDF